MTAIVDTGLIQPFTLLYSFIPYTLFKKYAGISVHSGSLMLEVEFLPCNFKRELTSIRLN